MGFAEVVSRGWYKRARHLDFLNTVLVWLAKRQAPVWLMRKLGRECPGMDDDELVPFHKLMVQQPPRTSKSETVSHMFAAWYVGTFPDHHVIVTSYGQEKAADYGRAARDTLVEYGEPIFGIKIRQDSDAAHRWQIEGHRGGMYAAGVGGALTGRGANCFITDDALKNGADAWSSTIQDNLANWYESTADTRLEPDAIEIDVGTRWHTKDLAGYKQASSMRRDEDSEEVEVEEWAVLSFPAIAEEDDQLGREPGEVLWPDRFSHEAVYARRQRMLRTDIGKYYWFAMYQQKPALPEGLLFFDKTACEYGRDHAPEPRERINTSPLPGQPADGFVLVWERFRPGETYYIGADTAGGKGEALGTLSATGGPDRNHAAIYRLRDDVQVAAIHGRQEEHQFAALLDQWGRSYGNALLAVERNRRAVLVALQLLRYPNLYATPPSADTHLRPSVNPERRIEYGWDTNSKTRGPLLAELQGAISSHVCNARDKEFWEEALVFVQGDPPQAMPGMHDDRIIAHAIARQARKKAASSSGSQLQHIGTGLG